MAHDHPDGLPAIDIFAGAGGLSIGLEQAGFSTVAGAEIDRDALATFGGRYQDQGSMPTLLQGDIADHDFQRWRGNIALVAGGPPCQPYSFGGRRLGGLDPRDGLPQYLRVIQEVEPNAFILENVPGLASLRARKTLDSLLGMFRELGYEVSWRILRAADYGVCQRRQRLFVIGTKGSKFVWPTPTHGVTSGTPWLSASDLLDLDHPLGEANDSIVTYAKNPDLRPSPWDGHLWNGGGRAINPDGLVPTLLASMGGNKTPWLDTKGIVPEYHRHLVSGGAPRSGVVEGARRITVKEAALIQGFPPEMDWSGGRSSRYRQIGNAVPVQLAHAVGSSLSDLLIHQQREVIPA
jgi:DNA (cytosine-5)-methyltransferase 1